MNFETRVKHLVSALLDDSITKEEGEQLDKLLQESEDARKIYRRMVDMDITLQETSEFEAPFKDLPQPEEMPEKFRATRFQLHVFQAIAASLLIALVITFTQSSTEVDKREVVKSIPQTVKTEEIVLARIIEMSSNVNWQGEPHLIGDDLFAEKLVLTEGSVLIKYENGAEIKLEAPVSYELKSLSYAKIDYGDLAARIPQAAQGFTVDSPRASVVDLGTEFSMKVDKNGETHVFVFEGEVETSLIGEDGNTFKNARLSANEGVVINDDLSLIKDQSKTSSFVRISTGENPIIEISDKYVKAVKNDQAVAYWRFEEGREHVNEASELFPLSFENGLAPENGVLSFKENSDHYFKVNSPIHDINSEGYTVEFWLNPDEYRSQMSLLSFVLPDQPTWHLLYTSLTGEKDGLKHSPFNVRMSSRFPAANGYGSNCFSNQAFMTRQWSHYVFVKDDESLAIYIDGELANTVKTSLGSDNQAYQLCFGRIDPERSMRYYVGQLDELAIYNYPLEADQIKGHFEAQVK